MLSPKQQKALQALISCNSKAEAAEMAGITPRTLSEYQRLPEFREALQAAFMPMIAEATRQAQRALSPALKALETIVGDETASAGSRIAAARTLLEYGLKLTEYNDILPTLEALENANRVD